MSSIGIVWDERYLNHNTGYGHPECAARLTAIKEVLQSVPDLNYIPIRPATKEDVLLVHTIGHVDLIDSIREVGSGHFDGDTPFSAGSHPASYLAVGGVLGAVDQVNAGFVKSAFAFPRPPGHHAEASHPMGFCLFNNVAIAAEHLVKRCGLKRVAVVDFDVHHGNGIQNFFYNRSDVYYISTHRYPFYPGTGSKTERGKGEGLGYTLNVPFSSRAGDDDFERAFDDKIIYELDKYKPEFILVSAGFDAHQYDPLGGLGVTKAGFAMMANRLNKMAKKHAGGKIVYVLEGGYDMKGLQEGVGAVLEEL